MKGGLHELALTAPISALTRDEAVAQDRPEGARAEVLDVVFGVADQHLLDQVRIAGKKNTLRSDASARQSAIVARGLEQKI